MGEASTARRTPRYPDGERLEDAKDRMMEEAFEWRDPLGHAACLLLRAEDAEAEVRGLRAAVADLMGAKDWSGYAAAVERTYRSGVHDWPTLPERAAADGAGEHCQDCGEPYRYVWSAPNHLWNALLGDSTGMLCVGCFDRRLRNRNVAVRWVPAPMGSDLATDLAALSVLIGRGGSS